MRSPILVVTALTLAPTCISGQDTRQPSFEVASVKPAPAGPTSCSGGPGTADPGLWRCSNVPLWYVITQAYDFEAYQFPPNDPCCRERFDFTARVPAGATKEQFHRMIRNLLEDRFKLKLHLDKKQMEIYELTVGERGTKMKESSGAGSCQQEEPGSPPQFKVGADGYPVFPPRQCGLVGAGGHYRWVGFDVSMEEIVKTLSFHLGRPVVNVTQLTGNYDVDLRWWIDIAWILERAGHADEAKELPVMGGSGPPLTRAVEDQLGLKLTSRKGQGAIVIIDHLERVPTEN